MGVAEELRRALQRDGRSRYRIAKDSGLSEAGLSRFFNGERALKLETAEKLAGALGFELVLRWKRKAADGEQ